MTADIVNLRKARKRKQRDERATKAAENRAKFGQTKAEKRSVKANTELEVRRLDQAMRQTKDQDGE